MIDTAELIEILRRQAETCAACGVEDPEHDHDEKQGAALLRFEAKLFQQAASRLASLQEEVERLREALKEIARQKLRAEMADDVIEGVNADWEHGYECCVHCARSALSPVSEGER